MKRKDYAKMINCQVEYLSREQRTNWKEKWQEGDILEVGKDLGLCWTDGGYFIPENEAEYSYVIKATGNIKAHKVDYTDKEETRILCATDCEKEKEYLIPDGTQFEITYISSDDDFKEMGYYIVEVELVEDEVK